jgi:hypothetical protein
MFKSYHPRENELYREFDDEYRQAAAALKEELLRKWRALIRQGREEKEDTLP